MKMLMLPLLLSGGTLLAVAHTDDFKVECSGSFTVVNGASPFYLPPIPPHGRVPGKDTQAGFSAQLALKPDQAGCTLLKEKYGIDLTNTVHTTFFLSGVNSYDEAVTSTQTVIGQSGSYTVTQKFKYERNGELPLFPLAHEEQFLLSGGTDSMQDALQVSYSVDSAKVYGIPKTSELPKTDTLELIETLQQEIDSLMAERAFSSWLPMPKLLLSIQSSDADINFQVFKTLIHIFERAEEFHTLPFFFDFFVGGSDGTELALKLNTLSHLIPTLGSRQKVSIATQYPGLLLVSNTEESCFNLDKRELARVVNNLQIQTEAKLIPSYRVSPSTLQRLKEELNSPIHHVCAKSL